MLADADSVLRAEGAFAVGSRELPAWRLTAVLVAASFVHGAVLGTYGGNVQQSVYSAVKLPVFVVATTLVCLPFFWALNSALGLAADLRHALRAIVSAQVSFSVCLASLSPVIALLYVSDASYPRALAGNAIVFVVAALAAQITLRRHYGPLLARNRVHRVPLAAWFALYLFVAVKMGSILRPFVGDPNAPLQFFRETAFTENPYASLFWAAWAIVVEGY